MKLDNILFNWNVCLNSRSSKLKKSDLWTTPFGFLNSMSKGQAEASLT